MTASLALSHKHDDLILLLRQIGNRTSHTDDAVGQSLCWARRVARMVTSVLEVLVAP